MRKLWLIAWHAFSQRARAPWFLFFYFGLPLVYAALVGLTSLFFNHAMQGDWRPVGLVDQAQIIQTWPGRRVRSEVALLSFADEAAAHQALLRGDIQGYYVIGPDYLDTGRLTEVAPHLLSSGPEGQVTRLLRDQLLAQTPPERRARLARENVGFLPHRTLDNNDFQLQYMLKTGLAWGMLFAFALLSTITSFFLMNMLVEEHTNRTAEVLLSSVSAEQLLAGKIIGLSALGLTPPVVWGGVGALAVPFLLRAMSDYGLEAAVRVPWLFLLLCVVLFLPAYMLNGLSAALAGAIVGTTGQGYRIVSFISGMIPTLLWMPAAFISYSAPSAPASLFFSLFPLTAPIALPMRAAQVVVPAWQVAAGIGLLYLTLGLSLRYSARIYRASWLIEGQKYRLRSIWLALRGK
jgi:ABC-2 type transport system permease protein